MFGVTYVGDLWNASLSLTIENLMIEFEINGQPQQVDADPNMPLLWVIRDILQLTGTKFGCGLAQCGACTVHLNGNAIRSCVTPVIAAQGAKITTIEGVALDSDNLHPLQQAWLDEQVPQCGYCQSGQIMSALSLLNQNPNPDDAAIDSAMSGNICRCGMYGRIRNAIKRGAKVVNNFDPNQQQEV